MTTIEVLKMMRIACMTGCGCKYCIMGMLKSINVVFPEIQPEKVLASATNEEIITARISASQMTLIQEALK